MEGILLFPNPTDGQFFIDQLPESTTSVRVHDAKGQIVLEQVNPSTTMDLGVLPAGTYTLQFLSDRRCCRSTDRQNIIRSLVANRFHQVEQTLAIIFENEDLVAINKPHGLLVHRTPMAKDATEFAVQLLRDQIGQHVYPVHRLDRKTSGVLLFAKSAEANQELQLLFRERQVNKTYQAIVRGYMNKEGEIDYPLTEGDKTQEAQTTYRLLEQFEIDLPSGGFPTSRYSLVELKPRTGRYHQLRKHMAHIRHPIIGDRPHGCNKQNRLWKEHFQMTTLLLHAEHLSFEYPTGTTIDIQADRSAAFSNALNILRDPKNKLVG